MTWAAGQPARVGTGAVGDFGSTSTGRVSVPVSGVTGSRLVSLQLYADSTDSLDFSSSEHGTVGNRPQLVLTITSP